MAKIKLGYSVFLTLALFLFPLYYEIPEEKNLSAFQPEQMDFKVMHGGRWRVSPQRIYGYNIDIKAQTGVREINEKNVENITKKFISQNEDLLKVNVSDLRLRRIEYDKPFFPGHEEGTWYIFYKQFYNDIPVYKSSFGLILINGKVVKIISSFYPDVDVSPVPKISEMEALEIAKGELRASIEAENISLLIFPQDGRYHLAWKVELPLIKDPFGKWIFFIDAHDGRIIQKENKIIYDKVSGIVSARIYPEYPQKGNETVYLWNESIFAIQDGDIAGYDFTDSNGYYEIEELTGIINISSELKGLYVDVDNEDQPDANHTFTLSVPGSHSWNWESADFSYKREESNVFYHVNLIHDFFTRGSPFDIEDMNYQMRAIVEYGSFYCNAFTDLTDIYFFGPGGECEATSLGSDIIYHEYTHVVTHKIYDYLPYMDETGAMDEGWADYFGCSILNRSTVGEGIWPSPIRDLNNSLRYPDDMVGEVHADGRIFGGALWDLRSLLGNTTADSLIIRAMKLQGMSFSEYLDDLLIVDDDNGDLWDGTPHSDEICRAFYDNHGIFSYYCFGPHHLAVSRLQAPPYVSPGEDVIINATIKNEGAVEESDIEVQFLVNDSLNSTKTVTSLLAGESINLSFTWSGTEGIHNLTVYVVPVPGEKYTADNIKSKLIAVTSEKTVKAVVLDSWGTDYASSASWDDLNENCYGMVPIKIDYKTLNKENITLSDLESSNADVLIISYAFAWEFTDSEIDAIKRYTKEGHGLIGTAGTLYYGVPNNNKLAPLWGLREDLVYGATSFTNLTILDEKHPIFKGVQSPYTPGTPFGATPPDYSWDEDDLAGGKYIAISDGNYSAITVNRNVTFIAHWIGYNSNEEDKKVLYNAIVWSKWIVAEHDIEVELSAPPYARPGKNISINVTINNWGISNESDVEVRFLVNGSLEENKTISFLPNMSSFDLTFIWSNSTEGVYNLSVYAPLSNDSFPSNNLRTKYIQISSAEILLVDDDNGETYEKYFENALSSTNHSYVSWKVHEKGSPSNETLLDFDEVIWFTGSVSNIGIGALTPDSQSSIINYLENGGSLFITSQEISDLYYGFGPEAGDFIDYLHVKFITDDVGIYEVEGIPGDRIGNGLSFGISGGDGADNQWRQEEIFPADENASIVFNYTEDGTAGIKVDTGKYKVVYFAFGFEAINNSTTRKVVMDRIVRWLRPQLKIEAPEFVGCNQTFRINVTIRNTNETNATGVNATILFAEFSNISEVVAEGEAINYTNRTEYNWTIPAVSKDAENKWIVLSITGKGEEYGLKYIPHEWENCSGTVRLSECDDCGIVYELPWEFTFYGEKYKKVYLSSNGFIDFDTEESQCCCHPQEHLHGANMISALWEDGHLGYGNETNHSITTCEYDDRVVIEYSGGYCCSDEEGMQEWQIILYRDGRIKINYKRIDRDSCNAAVGISGSVPSKYVDANWSLNQSLLFFSPGRINNATLEVNNTKFSEIYVNFTNPALINLTSELSGICCWVPLNFTVDEGSEGYLDITYIELIHSPFILPDNDSIHYLGEIADEINTSWNLTSNVTCVQGSPWEIGVRVESANSVINLTRNVTVALGPKLEIHAPEVVGINESFNITVRDSSGNLVDGIITVSDKGKGANKQLHAINGTASYSSEKKGSLKLWAYATCNRSAAPVEVQVGYDLVFDPPLIHLNNSSLILTINNSQKQENVSSGITVSFENKDTGEFFYNLTDDSGQVGFLPLSTGRWYINATSPYYKNFSRKIMVVDPAPSDLREKKIIFLVDSSAGIHDSHWIEWLEKKGYNLSVKSEISDASGYDLIVVSDGSIIYDLQAQLHEWIQDGIPVAFLGHSTGYLWRTGMTRWWWWCYANQSGIYIDRPHYITKNYTDYVEVQDAPAVQYCFYNFVGEALGKSYKGSGDDYVILGFADNRHRYNGYNNWYENIGSRVAILGYWQSREPILTRDGEIIASRLIEWALHGGNYTSMEILSKVRIAQENRDVFMAGWDDPVNLQVGAVDKNSRILKNMNVSYQVYDNRSLPVEGLSGFMSYDEEDKRAEADLIFPPLPSGTYRINFTLSYGELEEEVSSNITLIYPSASADVLFLLSWSYPMCGVEQHWIDWLERKGYWVSTIDIDHAPFDPSYDLVAVSYGYTLHQDEDDLISFYIQSGVPFAALGDAVEDVYLLDLGSSGGGAVSRNIMINETEHFIIDGYAGNVSVLEDNPYRDERIYYVRNWSGDTLATYIGKTIDFNYTVLGADSGRVMVAGWWGEDTRACGYEPEYNSFVLTPEGEDLLSRAIEWVICGEKCKKPFIVEILAPKFIQGEGEVLIRSNVSTDGMPVAGSVNASIVFFEPDKIRTEKIALYDDGLHGDVSPNDGIYGNTYEVITDADTAILFIEASSGNNYNWNTSTLVVDREPPEITSFTLSSTSVYVGEEIRAECKAKDDKDPSVKTEISGIDTSSTGTKTALCTATDEAGNKATSSIQYNVRAKPSPGGDGPPPKEEIPTPTYFIKCAEVHKISSIEAGESFSAIFRKCIISQISLLARSSIKDLRFEILEIKDKPLNIKEDAPGLIYGYFIIETENLDEEDIERAELTFRIKKPWIMEKRIDEDTIRLYRYKNGWEELSTQKLKEDEENSYFSAILPGFSVFTISGEKEAIVTPEVTPIKIPEVIPPEVSTPTPLPVEQPKISINLIWIGIFLAILPILFLIKSRRKRKP